MIGNLKLFTFSRKKTVTNNIIIHAHPAILKPST
jgi:hypothetical protein